MNAVITGEGVHHSLTLHQLSASGYYEGGQANKENHPINKFSSHEKTSQVPIMKQRYYFDKLSKSVCYICCNAGH